MKNWLILIAIITIPSILAYQYLELPENFLEESIPSIEGLSDVKTKQYDQSDNQNEEKPSKVLQQETKTRTTDSGVTITTTKVVEERLNPLDIQWDKSLAIRFEHSLPKNEAKTEKVIYEFSQGNLSHVYNDCELLENWYQFYYFSTDNGIAMGLWSSNQEITDFFRLRMNELGCDYFELPEGNKEKLIQMYKEQDLAVEEIEKIQRIADEAYGK